MSEGKQFQFDKSLFVLAIAFSNSKSPLLRTPLTIKFALTFLQKSIVRPSTQNFYII